MIKLFKVSTLFVLLACLSCSVKPKEEVAKVSTGAQDREYCVNVMRKIVDPVLIPIQDQNLDKVFPRKDWEVKNDRCDLRTTVLQAVGRSISGLSPWLSLGVDDTPEGQIRAKYIEMSRVALINITDPNSADYQFQKETETYERIVHNAYVAYPLLIAPEQLWEPLTAQQKENVINALKTHREYKPFNNNWILFSSLIEATIWKLTGECDMEKLEAGVEAFKGWYLGDGMYGDGASHHWDYYNSYVIHPLLMEVLKVCVEKDHKLKEFYPIEKGRAQRYAEIQEHLISPEGTFPIIGRSNNYRIGAFQHLGYMAYRKMLFPTIELGATRAALVAVTKNMMDAPGVYDEDGWLVPGVVGSQINSRDIYTVTGALYMCTMGLTQLGLPADDPFWTEPAGKWFQKRVWDGDDIPKQHEYYGK